MHEAWHFGNPMSGLALLMQSDLVWYGGQYNHNQIHIVLQHAAPHIGFSPMRSTINFKTIWPAVKHRSVFCMSQSHSSDSKPSSLPQSPLA